MKHLVRSIVSAEEGEEGPPRNMWRSVMCAAFYLCLVYLGYAMIFTPLPEMSLEWECKARGLEWDQCNKDDGGETYKEAQKASANWQSIYGLSSGVGNVMVCGFFGVLGDAWGRRYALLLPVGGMAFQGLNCALMPYQRRNDLFLILTFIFSFGGGTYATNHAACAVVADVTQHCSAETRSKILGFVEAANWLGLLAGPLIGAYMAKILGNQAAFWPSMAVGAVNFTVTFFFFQETLEKSRRKPFSFARANPIAAFGLFCQDRFALTLAGMLGFAMLCGNGNGAVVALYMNYAISNVEETTIGLTQTVGLGSGCLGLFLIFPLLVKVLSLQAIVRVALANCILCWCLMSGAHEAWEFLLFSGLQVLVPMIYPIMRTGMTNTFGKRRYGEALAAMGTLEQTCNMFAAPIMQQVYKATTTVSFSLGSITIGCVTFIVGAGFAVVSLIIAMFPGEFPKNSDHGGKSSKADPDERPVNAENGA